MPTESIALCPTCLTTQSISNSYCINCATDLKNAHIYTRNTETIPSLQAETSEPTTTQQLRLKRQRQWWRKYLPPNHELYRRIDNVRKNNYMSLRLAAQEMTRHATFFFGMAIATATVSGIGTFIYVLQKIDLQYQGTTLEEAIWPKLTLSPLLLVISIIAAYIFSLPFMQLGYRTLERRDELLMRIDSAINTASIATNLEQAIRLLTQIATTRPDASSTTENYQ